MILAAYQFYRGVIEATYPQLLTEDKILHLDHIKRVTTLVQGYDGGKAVQLYVPDLIEATPTFNRWRARADVLASSVNDALILADVLTARLAPDSRDPQLSNRPRTETLSGAGYGVCRIVFDFIKKA